MNHPTNDQGLLQEIEEDLQRQRFESLWKKFGPAILGLAATIVLVTALFTGWQNYRTNKIQKNTEALWQILDQEFPSDDERRQAFEAYAEGHGKTTQALLARLYVAGAEVKKGASEKAVEIYDSIEADQSADPVLRQLATLLAVQTSLDSGDPAKLEERLAPLIEKKSAWAPLAAEYAGHLALRAGDRAKARSYFISVVAMEKASEHVTQRCAVMVEWLDRGE